MSDPLLPAGISLGSGVAEDGGPTVVIDLGKLLQLGDVTVKIVLPVRQAHVFAALVHRQADLAARGVFSAVAGGRP
jgi:hypothetical protein